MFTERRAKSLPLAVLVIALVLAAAAPASAATLTGTVVQRAQGSHKFVIASATGRLTALKARRTPRVGQTVRVVTRGSAGARSIRLLGRRTTVRLRGVVTRASRTRRVFTVSGSGATIRVHQGRGGASAAAADAMPSVGTVVTVSCQIEDDDDLISDHWDDEGDDEDAPRAASPTPPGGSSGTTQTPGTGSTQTPTPIPAPAPATVELDGTIGAIDGQTRTVSVNGFTAGAAPTKVVVPAPFDMSRFGIGDYIRLQAARQPDGTLVFQRIVPNDVLDVTTTIVAIDGSTRTLTTQACDATSCAPALSVLVPASFDLSRLHVGQRVDMRLLKRMDGTVVLMRAGIRSWQRDDDEDDDD